MRAILSRPDIAHVSSYGGIFESTSPAREYTLDDFVTLNLEKLDRYVHLRGMRLDELEWKGSDDEDGSDSVSDEDDEASEGDEEQDEDELEEDDEDDEYDGEEKERRHAALTLAEKVCATGVLEGAPEADVMPRKRCGDPQRDSSASPKTRHGRRRTLCPRPYQERDSGPSTIDLVRLDSIASLLQIHSTWLKGVVEGEYWAATAYAQSGTTRGKALRREGFRESSFPKNEGVLLKCGNVQSWRAESTRCTSRYWRRSRGFRGKRKSRGNRERGGWALETRGGVGGSEHCNHRKLAVASNGGDGKKLVYILVCIQWFSYCLI